MSTPLHRIASALVAVTMTSLLAFAGCAKPAAKPLQIGEPAESGDVGKLPSLDSNARYGTLPDTSGQATDGSQPPVIFDPPIVQPPVQGPVPQLTGGRIHVAQAKDNYYRLAIQYYGDGKKWQKIQDANPTIPANKIPVGARILIPD